MHIYGLVDFNNIPPKHQGRGVVQMLQSITKTIKLSDIPEIKGINYRLYGGWYHGNSITKKCQLVQADVGLNFPSIMSLYRGKKLLRIRAELGFSLICRPTIHLFNTYRTKSFPYGIKSKNKDTIGCQIDNCPLDNLHYIIKKKSCPRCSKNSNEFLSRGEQKLVDTMLSSDLLYLSKKDESIILVSSDEDFFPVIIQALTLGTRIIHISPNVDRKGIHDFVNESFPNYIFRTISY